jgi:formylglycine-generating enzyme required for sulfatase activity
VTAGQYTEFLNAVAGVDTYGLYYTDMSNTIYGCGITQSGDGTVGNPYTYSVAVDFANRPVICVSWGDSARFANWLHNGQPTGMQDLSTTEDGSYFLNGATSDTALMAVTRKPNATWVIPSEDEWYKAAYHKNDGVTGNYFDYPTSSDTINPDMANYNWSIGHTTDVGIYNYPSPYGTFDQGGNVFEWNEAILYGSYRGVRGGSFNNSGADSLLAAVRNYYALPTYQDHYVGFRVAGVPEPASMAVLALGGIAMFVRRKGLRG